MVSAATQKEPHEEARKPWPWPAVSLSLVEADDGWSSFLCPKLVNSSSSGGFHVTFEWLDLHAACTMRITSNLYA